MVFSYQPELGIGDIMICLLDIILDIWLFFFFFYLGYKRGEKEPTSFMMRRSITNRIWEKWSILANLLAKIQKKHPLLEAKEKYLWTVIIVYYIRENHCIVKKNSVTNVFLIRLCLLVIKDPY